MTRRLRLQLSSVVKRSSLKSRAALPVCRLMASARASSGAIAVSSLALRASPRRRSRRGLPRTIDGQEAIDPIRETTRARRPARAHQSVAGEAAVGAQNSPRTRGDDPQEGGSTASYSGDGQETIGAGARILGR